MEKEKEKENTGETQTKQGEDTEGLNHSDDAPTPPDPSTQGPGPKDHWWLRVPRNVPFAPLQGDLDILLHSPFEEVRNRYQHIHAQTPAPDTWTEVPGELFQVRGPDYLTQSQTNAVTYKQPSAPQAYECQGVNIFRSSFNLEHACQKINSLREFLQAQQGVDEMPGDAPQFLCFVFLFSNWWKTEFTAAVHIFKRTVKIVTNGEGEGDDPKLDQRFSKFMNSNTKDRNSRLKFLPRVAQANPALKSSLQMLGGERPVIIGTKLTTKYYEGPNYLEISHDVGSSNAASMLCSVVLKSSGSIVIDYSWLIEGQAENELPERILCSNRFNYTTAEDVYINLDDEGNAKNPT